MTRIKEKEIPWIKLSDLPISSSMDVRGLREHKEILKESFRKRRLDSAIVEEVYNLDKEWRDFQKAADALRAEKNKLSKEISKTEDEKVKEKLKKNAAELDKNMVETEKRLREITKKRRIVLMSLPNIVDPNVPLEEIKVIFKWGTPKVLNVRIADFEEKEGKDYVMVKSIKSHYDILREYGLADEEKGGEVAGQRFYYMKNELVLLDMALSMYAMKKLYNKGFRPIIPPYMVKRFVEEGATTFAAFEEMIYKIEGEDSYLIPTSEHPIAAYHSNSILDENSLPIRYAGFSASFRKEAGAHGKDTKGIFRNHHFNKVEQYIICKKEDVEKELNGTIRNQVELLKDLGLPLRVIAIPAWDMDAKAIYHFDVEAWFPAQNTYREMGSHATVGTWQAYRLNIRYRKNNGERDYPHTIYGTMVAVERTLAAVLENCLEEDGRIIVPKPLAELCGIDEIKPKKV